MKAWDYQPDAQSELAAAVAWYENERTGLGAELLDVVEETLASTSEHPLPGIRVAPTVPDHFRRVLMPRFQYALIVDVRADRRLVLAVAHMRRRPHYWHARLAK
jgi:hypothetical protein